RKNEDIHWSGCKTEVRHTLNRLSWTTREITDCIRLLLRIVTPVGQTEQTVAEERIEAGIIPFWTQIDVIRCSEDEGMLEWEEVVGCEEKRMKRLARLHQLALAVVCTDGALARVEKYLGERVPRESLAIVKGTVGSLWQYLKAPKRVNTVVIEKDA